MDADGGKQHGMGLGQFDDGPARGQGDARNQDAFDPGLGSAFQHGGAVGVEFVEIQVAVGVGERQGLRLPDAGYFESILQDGLHFVFVSGLAVDAHDGFGAAEADEQPAAVFEFELEAV